ncbi:MAG: DNA polymerase III subunit delta [Candidatus Moranbacteria bacterium]|nr:DNA polymerase III subunit delta [Candidatus Moranbacteria bacterium]MDD3964595.1 DNA polymerase III subunit delta [Candidatus Moranbacteria bacterium]
MIFFVHGEDDFLVNKRRGILQKSFLEHSPEGELFVFDFEDQGTMDAVKKSVSSCASGLFSSKKMIVFLHPFQLEEGAEHFFLDFLQAFVVKNEKDTTLLFVEPGKIKKTNTLVKFLLKHRDTEEVFTKPEARNMNEYIKTRLSSLDAKAQFSREALSLFIVFLGNNTARIETELEKLSTFKPGGIFEKEDVLLLVGSMAENVIFEALDALAQGNRQKALVLFRQELVGSEGVYPLLGLCAWQVRRFLLVRELYDRGMSQPALIATQIKVPPFVVQKILGVVKHFPMTRIKKGLMLLSDFDTALKQGTLDPLVALDLFVWKF